jgi:hypothetical protein
MIWDLLDRLINRRERAEQLREMDEMVRNWDRQRREMDRRIAELFTPEEWQETAERCERRLREMQQ